MDRKAVGFCAVAASASLGVLLSAGCGTDSAQPARMAKRDTRSSAPAPVVVVSPEPHFFESERPSITVSESPAPASEAVVVSTVTDPYAESSADPLSADPYVESSPDAPLSDETQVVADADEAEAPTETLSEPIATEAPVEEVASSVELRFSDGETPAEVSDAEKTVSVEVGPRGKSKPRKVEPSRVATNERRGLQPLMVTARQLPGQPTPAEQAQVEPTATEAESEAELPAPVEVATAPTVARVAEKTPTVAPLTAAPLAPSKLVPAPVTIVAAPVETPDQKVVVVEPTLAKPAAVIPAAEPASPVRPQAIAKAEPVDKAPAPKAIEAQEVEIAEADLQPEPVAANPSTLRIAEAMVASTPEPIAAASPAALQPAEVVASPPAPQVVEPVATVAAPPVVAQSPEPIAPAVAAQPQVVAERPIVKNQPQPVIAAPAPVVAAPAPVIAAPVPVVAQAAPPVAQPAAPILPDPTPNQPVPAEPVPARPVATSPTPPAAPVRSPALVASMAQADERVRHAIQLAEKGAMYASRKEFTSALTLISQARDIEYGTRQYGQATAAGLQALKEANDFVKPGSASADLSRVVAGHKTPILKGLDVSDLPPTLAAQHYYDYAKVQLSAGIGRETVGSIALYGLGRIIVAGAGANAQQLEYTGPAMALYQAALICEPQNFRAAHELGVLLASTGQLELARNMLLGSASASPQPMMWKNLAVVHSRLGEAQLAAEAHQKATVLEQTSPNAKTPAVRWVDPATFSQLGSASDPTLLPNSATPATASPAEAVPSKKPSNVARSRSEWDPLNLRR